MSATYISFDDWREAVRTDQRNRIEQLRISAEHHDPHGIVIDYLNQARDAWYSNPTEAERCIRLAQDHLNVEREWESERITKAAVIAAQRKRRR